MNRSILCLALSFSSISAAATAATLPAGFTETVLTSGLSNPTAMALAPDGRFFVAEQGGDLRVIKNGTLLGTPFVHLPVNDDGERGLLGVAIDPDFASNHFVYAYYTATTPTLHNRVSRFTAQGDVAAGGSETAILDLDNLSGATNHNGGAIHFGPDGKLYVAAGENANAANSQSLSTVLGKLLRIESDGSVPADNPFFGSTTGKNRAIWALGLRNPFTFTFSRTGTRLFINDVGQSAWEEIDDGIAGSNYGWPNTEGPTNNPAYRGPLFAYSHDDGCAITGGAFYDPAQAQFPAAYTGKYFFSDLCGGWIHRFDPVSKSVVGFATGIDSPVDLLVDDAGNLYYLAYGAGALVRVSATTTPPPPAGGLGLLGSYFDGLLLSGPVRTRLDKQVAFDWSYGQALPGLDGDTFSVRWTGKVLSKNSGTYAFITNSDDGVRLWVDNKKLIDNWTDHSPAEDTGSVTLAAGQLYDIRLEFYENSGTAVIQLFWDGPGFSRQVVPQANLFPYALVLTGEPPATAADTAVGDRLRQNGFAPQLQRGSQSTSNDTKGKALLLVSASVDPATIAAKFRSSSTPAVIWESALYDDFGMTGTVAGTSFGTIPTATRLRITAPGHPLAAGLHDAVTVAGSPSTFSFGEPNSHATVVARQFAGPRHPVLFAYERGAAMVVGVAPARRVGLFFGDTTAASLNADGWKLFDAAVKWAIGK